MSSKSSLKRSIKTSQLSMRQMFVKVEGTAANAVSGFDRLSISSVDDLGAGNYKVNLDGKAYAQYSRAIELAGWSSSTADVALQVVASDHTSITVQATIAGAPADADIALTLLISDWKLDYKA